MTAPIRAKTIDGHATSMARKASVMGCDGTHPAPDGPQSGTSPIVSPKHFDGPVTLTTVCFSNGAFTRDQRDVHRRRPPARLLMATPEKGNPVCHWRG